MVDINDIFIGDIELFLTINNVSLSEDKQINYDIAFEMIRNDKQYQYSEPIMDWIVAYRLTNDIEKIDRVSRREIMLLTYKGLENLANSLGIFSRYNLEDSVVNVLKYLKKFEEDSEIEILVRTFIKNNEIRNLAFFICGSIFHKWISMAREELKISSELLVSNKEAANNFLIYINEAINHYISVEPDHESSMEDYNRLLPYINSLFPNQSQDIIKI